MNQQDYAARRRKFLQRIGENNAAILFSADEKLRNGDVHFPFRQDSDFFYLTGFQEPESIALFLPRRKEGEFVLFNRAPDPFWEKWLGPRAGQEGACHLFGADQAFDIKQLDEKITELLLGRDTLYYSLGKCRRWDRKVSGWVSILQSLNRKASPSPSSLADINASLGEMRLIKNAEEIALIKKSCEISANAHRKLMQFCRPGMFEYELEALFDYEIKKQGCRSTAYGTIVGGGQNACVLHYVDNKDVLKSGDLVLIDAGSEYHNYAADITRTFPVNGKFSDNQAAIYQLVLDAQLAVIKAIKPGVPWNQLQEIAINHLTQGLINLQILQGPLAQAIEAKAYQEYYMHNIGHWLGIDVHDAGTYKTQGNWRRLEPGMVLTVEPGLYLSANEKLDEKWWHLGVRIEDDILVTQNGCEVLTEQVPKEIVEIQKLMRSPGT